MNVDDNKNKVLIVEDNDINATVLSHFLKPYHCEVTRLHNGREAVEYVKANPIDLVMMDINMPIMNGHEATIAIRHCDLTKQPYIIAVTADATINTRNACIDAGMNDLLAKPYSMEQFKQIISPFLSST